MKLDLDKFLCEYFKKNDTVRVNATELQDLVLEKRLLEEQVKNLREMLKTKELLLDIEKSRNNDIYTINLKG